MADKKLIYAVDDEEDIRELYLCALCSAGYRCVCFKDGESLFDGIKNCLPSLILLDIMLEGDDGYKILEKIRTNATTAKIPVIMVSAKGEEISKVKGLNLGADDYIAKPFGVLELVARIGANLRRTDDTADNSLSYMDIKIDEKRHTVTVGGNPVELTLKEYELLKLLIVNAPNLVPRESILTSVWGEGYFGETRTLDIHIAMLRRNIAESQAKINTVRGVGYLLK